VSSDTPLLRAHRVGDPRISPLKSFQISCAAIAVENLPRRRRRKKFDASTYQSNNFGVSRKRFKSLTPGSTRCYHSLYLVRSSFLRLAYALWRRTIQIGPWRAVRSDSAPLELHLTTSELWFGQEQEGILS